MVWKRAIEYLYSKIEYVLITLFILGLAGAVGVLPYLSTKFSHSLALEEAKRYTLALSEFRSLYTSEVVARVAGHGIQITHDYLEREGSIPLPATFSILLGERLEALEEGGQVRLYSEYPFPWRKDGGPRDDFEREALRQLKQNPTKPYYRFGEWNGHAVLRYATADTMKEACVSCHNSHPQTPKTGWKTGDLRGILEVIHPLESGTQQVNNILFRLIPVIIVLGGLGIIGLLFAFRKLRQTSQELELQVMQRTESLKGLNQQLQEEAEQRKASESKFRGLFEAAYDALIVVNEQGYMILLNDQVERLVGYSQQELLGRPIELLVPDCFHDNHPNHRASYGATPYRLHTGRQNTELWIKLKNGSECPVEISLSPFEEHGATMVLWTIRDISERTKSEEAIKVLARFPDEYPSPVLRLNKEGVILYANMASKLLLEEWQSAVDQQAPELWYQVIQECFFSNETRELEVWCGSILYSVQIVPVVQTGQVNLYARDITAMKNAQEAFRFLSIQHGQILNSAAEGIYGLDLGGKNTFVNSAGATMVGWELDELLGQSQHALIHHSKPDGTPYPREECPIYATFQDGIPRSHADEVFWRKDGTCFPVEYTTNPIRDDEGSLTGAVVTFRDISERKAAEGALQAAYLDTERLLSAISSILIGVDPMGRISRWNEMAERAFGFPSTVALGQKITEANILWDLSALEQGMQDCQTSGTTVFLAEVHYTTPSGEEGILSLRLTPVISDGKKETGCLILGMDVTENRQLQVQLALAQKMESIGHLAAGIAHEINTPAQFVNDNLQFLQGSFASIQEVLELYAQVIQALPEGSIDSHLLDKVNATVTEADLEYATEEIPKALQQSLDGAARVAKIVRAMNAFSHPGTGEKKPIDLNKAIESTITVARNEWKYVANVVTDLDPTLPLVSCLPGEFNQVILNLLINAAHAIGDVGSKEAEAKGTITVSTKVAGTWAEVRIADTGTGIPESIRKKVFDPFFTTKDVGKGTGQGLAIAHDVIVTKHEGTFTFVTETGTGTTFLIGLPLQMAPAPTEA